MTRGTSFSSHEPWLGTDKNIINLFLVTSTRCLNCLV